MNRAVMGSDNFLLAVLCFLAFFAFLASANDPDMLQDICVADLNSAVKVNGFVCKPAANVTSLDFFSTLLVNPGNTNNTFGAIVTAVTVEKLPGLNTLGISIGRIDYAPGGQNPPHTHPRATEIVFVLEGELFVGFLTTANKLFTKTIRKGDVFVFPKGLVHFQKNLRTKPAAVVAVFNSQLQGTVSLPTNLFAATPPVPDNVLAQAFQVNNKVVMEIKEKLAPKK